MNKFEYIKGISLYDLKSFLKSKGWKEGTHPNRKLSVFYGPKSDSGAPLEIFLPSSENFKDINDRISDVFSLLSNLYEIEQSKLSEILKGNKMETVENLLEKIERPGYKKYLLRLMVGDAVYLRWFNGYNPAPQLYQGRVIYSRGNYLDVKLGNGRILHFYRRGRLYGIETANCFYPVGSIDLNYRFYIVLPEIE